MFAHLFVLLVRLFASYNQLVLLFVLSTTRNLTLSITSMISSKLDSTKRLFGKVACSMWQTCLLPVAKVFALDEILENIAEQYSLIGSQESTSQLMKVTKSPNDCQQVMQMLNQETGLGNGIQQNSDGTRATQSDDLLVVPLVDSMHVLLQHAMKVLGIETVINNLSILSQCELITHHNHSGVHRYTDYVRMHLADADQPRTRRVNSWKESFTLSFECKFQINFNCDFIERIERIVHRSQVPRIRSIRSEPQPPLSQ